MGVESRLETLKLELPPPTSVMGLYRPIVVVDSIAYLSGHGPLRVDGTLVCGRVGDDLDVVAGKQAARQVGLAMLATLRERLGSLDRVGCLIKTFGLVQSTESFVEHPAVINGFSELMCEVFGDDAGVGARSAAGAAALPGGIAVEVEATFRLAE